MGPIIEKNNGFILQYLGDGFMAVVSKRSTDAVTASVEIHKTLHNYNAERILKDRLPIKAGELECRMANFLMGVTGRS